MFRNVCIFSAVCGLAGLFTFVAMPVPGGRDSRENFSGANESVLFRSQKRLSEDRTIPHGALMRAVEERHQLVDAGDGAGVWPGAWTYHGPTNVGGRVRDILIHPTNTNTMWTGGCSGGMWKTTDGGLNWAPLDDFMAVLPIGCMILDPTNPDTLYVGTGEGFFETVEGSSNTAAVRGTGIFKSTDGGTTWNQLTTTTSPDWYFVNRLAIHPNNSQIVLAATGSGIWKSTNGGQTWSRTRTGVIYDLRFHPTDASKLIAGTHDDGVLVSSDGGSTWVESTGDGNHHRSEVRYYRSNPDIVFCAASESDTIRLYKSLDGGLTFTLTNAGAGIGTYSAYNNVLWVNPFDQNFIIIGGVYLHRSTNGGASFTQTYNNVHADMHAIVEVPGFNNTTNKTVFFGTDGGVHRAADISLTTTAARNTGLGITQFYGAVMNPANNRILGGTQDNGTKFVNVPGTSWSNTFGGDGGYCDYDPTDPNYWYGEIYYAQMFRSTNGGSAANYVYTGIGDAGSASTCNFIPFFMVDPNNPNRLLMGARSLWRSNNIKAATPSWASIKGTIQPRDAAQWTKGEAHFAANPPYNISTFAIAKGNSDIIWVGYNNGEVWKTTNGTATTPTWTRADSGMPGRWVGSISIHPTDHNRVFVSYMGYDADNLWRTTNGGTSWTEVSGSLPASPISAVTQHPTIPGWVYVGTDVGLFTSSDDCSSWSTSNQGPGVVPVEELRWVTNTKLLCVTHGRGIFSADILSNAQPLSPDSFNVINGFLQSGKIKEAYVSDDKRINILADLVTIDDIYPVKVNFSTKSPNSTLTGLRVEVESSASINGLQLKIWLFNWTTGSYESVAAKLEQLTDINQVVLVTGNQSRFVNPTTQEISMQLTWESFTAELDEAFTARIDRVHIVATQ